MDAGVEVQVVCVSRVRPWTEDSGEIPARCHPQGVNEIARERNAGPFLFDAEAGVVSEDERGDVNGVALRVFARNPALIVVARSAGEG